MNTGWDDDEATAATAEPAIQTTVTIDLSGRAELMRDSSALVVTARALARIETKDDADKAGTFLSRTRATIKAITAKWADIKRPVKASLAELNQQEKDDLAELVAADALVAAPLLAWTVAEERRVKEENDRRIREREDAARRQQEEQAAAVRRAAETASTPAAAQQLERQARAIERADPLVIAGGDVEPLEDAPKVAGISVPKRKFVEVTDVDAFLKAIIARKIPRAAIKIEQGWLNKQATQLGSEFNYPGCTVSDKPHLSAR